MWCEGREPDCDAAQDLCLCGALRCLVHGHVEAGDDPWCRWWVEDPRARQGWSGEARPVRHGRAWEAWEARRGAAGADTRYQMHDA
jgi:hypothetical protein